MGRLYGPIGGRTRSRRSGRGTTGGTRPRCARIPGTRSSGASPSSPRGPLGLNRLRAGGRSCPGRARGPPAAPAPVPVEVGRRGGRSGHGAGPVAAAPAVPAGERRHRGPRWWGLWAGPVGCTLGDVILADVS